MNEDARSKRENNNVYGINPLDHLAGGEIAAGEQLYFSGKLRGEYDKRCLSIPKTLSEEEQNALRTNLREEVRRRQNTFAKTVVGQIDKKGSSKMRNQLKGASPLSIKRIMHKKRIPR